jgi:hypothetical protein
VRDPLADLLSVFIDKYGEADFGVRYTVCDLSFEQMQKVRAIIPVAIGVMEQMWRDEQARKPENQGKDASSEN